MGRDYTATWNQLIRKEMEHAGDLSEIVSFAPHTVDLDREFDRGFGGTEGEPFTLWTEERVYFPVEYDGAESVGSVPRWPCDEVTFHEGGG